MQRAFCCFSIVIVVGFVRPSAGQEPPKGVIGGIRAVVQDEVSMKTLGGGQFWGDVQFFRGWHIQQNVFSRHYRLLDPNDNRHAWGTLDECRTKLAEIRKQQKLPPMTGRGVILIHGILRSSKCMSSVAAAVEQDGILAFRFDYPSTQVSIPQAADYLHQTIAALEGLEEIDIIAHSMGGLVTRAYFAEHADPRVKRVVMIGTPNRGAELADLLYQNFLLRMASGPGGRQLVTDSDGVIRSLPAPKCEFAIIAGARGNSAGWNPFIPGDDDSTVTVQSTRLDGAADFSTVSTTHTALLRNREVIEQSVRFLNEGRLRADRDPQPIDDGKTESNAKPAP